NRFGYLLGCINLCVYSVVYFLMGLYASALSALFFSLPIQLMILLNWKRKAYGKATVFKKMNTKVCIFSALALILVFFVSQYLLTLFGSDYAMLDTAASLTGILTNILCMLTYVEYAYLGFLHVFLTISLNIQVTLQNPAHVTFLISSVYALYCATVTLINIKRIYKEQNK
ncbi:MAG: nicotinamide mononucleotide transporter, partial [Acutalibacteraceae bacterium]|nr:nicotinamide mononucleotide transporter [Acutalibacteraceae bacterium]